MKTTRNNELISEFVDLMNEHGRLISEFVDLMNEHGRESQEVKDFFSAHQDNKELKGLMEEALIVHKEYEDNQ